MPIINLNEVTENARPFLPSNTYTIRVADAESRRSQAGNPMVVLTWEIVAPESIEDADLGTVRIAGLQFREYLVFMEKAAARIKRVHRTLNLPSELDCDDENDPWGTVKTDADLYKGKAAYATIKTEKITKKNGEGEAMLDPANGEPMTFNGYSVGSLVSAAPELDIVVQ
tara:strand:+ start:2986 stop:3495 length:510 start_codon:yes stop_codon:yes gene_type:complete